MLPDPEAQRISVLRPSLEPFTSAAIAMPINALIAGHRSSTDSLYADARAVLRFTNSARSAGTERAYSSDWRDFTMYCTQNQVQFLPAQPLTVALYLAALAERGRKTATILRRMTAISVAHRRSGYSSPCGQSQRIVTETVQGIRRQIGVRQAGKAPMNMKLLRRILRRLPTDPLSGARDRAIILTGLAGGLRRSELSGIRVEHLRRHRRGFAILIPVSKTDQEQAGREVEIAASSRSRTASLAQSTCPVRALEHWLRFSGVENGPVFRRITRGQNLGKGLRPGSINWILKRALAESGLTSDQSARFGAHSLRSGFATIAYGNGATEIEISRQTGHRTNAMVRRYIGEERKQRRTAARKLGL